MVFVYNQEQSLGLVAGGASRVNGDIRGGSGADLAFGGSGFTGATFSASGDTFRSRAITIIAYERYKNSSQSFDRFANNVAGQNSLSNIDFMIGANGSFVNSSSLNKLKIAAKKYLVDISNAQALRMTSVWAGNLINGLSPTQAERLYDEIKKLIALINDPYELSSDIYRSVNDYARAVDLGVTIGATSNKATTAALKFGNGLMIGVPSYTSFGSPQNTDPSMTLYIICHAIYYVYNRNTA